MTGLRILFLGDVVGAPGIRAVQERLPRLVERTGARLVVANGENAAGGIGITPGNVNALRAAGVGVITTGNHVWARKEILGALGRTPGLLRPANYPEGAPGSGVCTVEVGGVTVGVVNLLGRVFMGPLDCPFRAADRVLSGLGEADLVLVDFHAEATSEKRALGRYLDGRVLAVVGTHTHVATADAQVLPGGTGYVTDVGMTGVADSIIGMAADRALDRFLTGIPRRIEVAGGDATLNGALLEADPRTGRCLGIQLVEDPP